MMMSLKKEVLSCFRRLHKTRLSVFRGDHQALKETRRRINEEFRKNMNEKDDLKIKEFVKFGNEVEEILRTQVVQAELKPDGVYELKPTKDTKLLDNFPYKDG